MQFSIKSLFVCLAIVSLVLVLLAPIRGVFPYFYYEQFNKVERNLKAIDGLVIRSSWQHKDMTLEDCGFSITCDGVNASLLFSDHQDWGELFDEFDGVILTKGNQTRYVSKTCFRDLEIDVQGLNDALKQLSRMKKIFELPHDERFGEAKIENQPHHRMLGWSKVTIEDSAQQKSAEHAAIQEQDVNQ